MPCWQFFTSAWFVPGASKKYWGLLGYRLWESLLTNQYNWRNDPGFLKIFYVIILFSLACIIQSQASVTVFWFHVSVWMQHEQCESVGFCTITVRSSTILGWAKSRLASYSFIHSCQELSAYLHITCSLMFGCLCHYFWSCFFRFNQAS